MLYINFPKKGVVQTFLRGRSNAGFAGVWADRELTFGRHLFSENWKGEIEREKVGGKKENGQGLSGRLTVTFFKLIYKLEGNKKRFSREIKYRFHAHCVRIFNPLISSKCHAGIGQKRSLLYINFPIDIQQISKGKKGWKKEECVQVFNP